MRGRTGPLPTWLLEQGTPLCLLVLWCGVLWHAGGGADFFVVFAWVYLPTVGFCLCRYYRY
jgi:hypothetical protein